MARRPHPQGINSGRGPPVARPKLLVKQLRLAGVSSAEAGNAFAPGYMEDYNHRFARAPANSHDAHRPLQDGEDLVPAARTPDCRPERETGRLGL